MNKRKIKKAIKRIKNLPKNKHFFGYIFNKIKHFFYKFTKSTKVAYPYNIMLELTNHCNLKCSTCPRIYEYGKNMELGKIDIIIAKKIGSVK